MPPPSVRVSGRRHELADRPADPPISGSLPLLPAIEPSRPESTSGFLSSHGELPSPRPPSPVFGSPDFDRPDFDGPGFDSEDTVVANTMADPVLRRTKVKLTPRPVRRVEEDDDDIRVYLAPPTDGLGTFDLGSVPASVTPPKSWRKAAWFASLSSGGVVVALLFAGSLLVESPNQSPLHLSAPGYRGGQPLMSGEEQAGPPGQYGSGAAAPTSDPRATRPAGHQQQFSGDPTSDTPSATGVGSPADPTASAARPTSADSWRPAIPQVSTKPQKPPITSAPMQSQPVRFWPQMDPQAMGRNSQAFLNTVPADPAAAAELTTGKLHDQGPQALAQRYADVAYFEVKNVYIDQDQGYTINTVEVTHDDGTKSVEQQTLTFGDGNKIESDGR